MLSDESVPDDRIRMNRVVRRNLRVRLGDIVRYLYTCSYRQTSGLIDHLNVKMQKCLWKWSLWELDDRGSLIRRGPDTVHLHVYTFSREFIAWISKSRCSSLLSVKVLHILQILSTCRYMKWVERSDSVLSDHFQGVNPLSSKNDQHKISPYNINAL